MTILPGLLVDWRTVMAGLTSLTPGQPSLQYPHLPLMYLPLESSLVEHQALPRVLMAVQEVKFFPR